MDSNQLRQRILDELNRTATDSIGSLTIGYAVNREINSAIKHYESGRFRWNEVREATIATTAQGTRTYSLPATFVKMDTLKLSYNGSWIPIRKRSWDEIDERDTQIAGSQGTPSIYAIYGNVVRLFPVPQGAYSLVGSYVRRFPPTSLTGSFCQVVTMGGGSLTATTTASHNNRLNGWTTDGEELIRHRAKAAVLINYLGDENAKIEAGALAQGRVPVLSVAEKLAYEKLVNETNDALTTGRIKPYSI